MNSLAQWVSTHFLYAAGLAILLVIAGAGIALGTKEGGWRGWAILAAGALLGIWALRLKGLL